LRKNAPKSMYEPVRSEDEVCWGGRKTRYPADVAKWLEVMAERGWTAPTWPREYGGGGLSRAEAKVLAEEMKRLQLRPPLAGFGLTMIGPLLLVEGSDEQKREHIPRIVRGEVRWCQGYSEPGSGSDLASLQTRAVADGDDYVVDGQKTWTSYADRADWMFLLVRTEPKAPKHEGISFLLMEMDSPGISVKPIRLISGYSPFCETFIEGVRVPRRNVVGRVNDGWRIAKALLGFERTMIADAFGAPEAGLRGRDRVVDLARRYLGEENGRIRDEGVRDRVVQTKFDEACLDLTIERVKDGAKAGQAPGPESSILKLYGTELNKRRHELVQSILGPAALGWEGEGFERPEIEATREWLRSRANSIEGGTSEIQLNIIAKRVLGLPD
ncbi:MAG: acyl-CoA dehydrogenase family protein, partial [Candidatus Binatia bacterium]